MKLLVQRIWKAEGYTIGRLYVDGKYFSDTLEDKDRGLKKTTLLSQIKAIKVKGQTAIPTGTYAVTIREYSYKFGQQKYASQYGFCKGYLPRILGVPGFDGILIHAGNTAEHTDGCLLVGKNTVKGMVTSSTATFKSLYELIKKADSRGENISITIE